MPRENRNEEKENRSPFGKLLYEKYLEVEGKSITQRQLVEAANAVNLTTYILSRMVTGKFEYGDKLHIHLYDIFQGLATFYNEISVKDVRELLDTIPNKPSIHLSDTLRGHLIAQLIEEGIVKQVSYTDMGIQFIGRDKDIEAVLTKLRDPSSKRFLMLIGTPGVGKSELAQQVGDRAKEQGYYAYVDFISLETFFNADEMMKEITKKLLGYNLQQTTLLILDNCEQIKNMAKARKQIFKLLNDHPQLTILATSRYAFSFPSHTVETLRAPTDAVRLFCAGVTRFQEEEYKPTEEDAPLLAEICQLLDGLPFALLIASALIEQKGSIQGLYESLLDMSIQRLTFRNDEPEHQVTLDALIKHSYKLLGNKEQKLLRWIAAFPSDCGIESIISICSKGALFGFIATMAQISGLAEDTENLLATLRKHHLIIYKDNVIAMHNTIRSFGRRMLNAAKEKDGYQEWEETITLLSLLLWYNSGCRMKMYLQHLYDPECLLEEAEEKKFLENGNEDNETIKKGLLEILFIYTLDKTDIFRRYHPQYPVLLDNVIEIYLHDKHEVETDHGVVYLDYTGDRTALTADERRQVFFTFFDTYYRANLFTLLLTEGDAYVKGIFAIYDLKDIWRLWDLQTRHLIGLTTSTDFVVVGAPGNMLENIDPGNVYTFFQ